MKTPDYSIELAEWIAREYAMADSSLADLHAAHPERCPDPLTVTRWRKRYPQFDLLMIEATEVRAEVLADSQLKIAGDDRRPAAQVRNMIQVRQWLAERLNRDRFGASRSVDVNVTGEISTKHVHELTRDQLIAIAQGAVIEGQAERIENQVDGTGQIDQVRHELEADARLNGARGQADPGHPPARQRGSPPECDSLVPRQPGDSAPEKISGEKISDLF